MATDDTIMPTLSKGKTANARVWVYVGDGGNPCNVFDFTLNRGRDGPKYFLKDYREVLLATFSKVRIRPCGPSELPEVVRELYSLCVASQDLPHGD